MEDFLYVLSVKSSERELQAVAAAPPDVRGSMLPRLLAKPLGKAKQRSLNRQVQLAQRYLSGKPLFGVPPIPFLLDCDAATQDPELGGHAALMIWEAFAKAGLEIRPVLTISLLQQLNDDDFESIIDLYEDFALRVDVADFLPPKETNELSDQILWLRKHVHNVDLFVNAGVIGEGHLFWYPREIQKLVKLIADVIGLKSIVISSASYPHSLSSVGELKHGSFPRYEVSLWEAVADELGSKDLVFGDHSVISPHFVVRFIPPKYHRGHINYTTLRRYHVWRGYPNVWAASAQYYTLAKLLETSEHFRGESYSLAEKSIKTIADRSCLPGDPHSWATNGILQHLIFTSRTFGGGAGAAHIGTDLGLLPR